MEKSTIQTKLGLSEMLKGGVIMDVMNVEQARVAEEAGACAVMALERVPAIIRKEGGIARASDPEMIKAIKQAVSIPVMAKCRIGHFVEARILEALDVDFIDESEVLTIADEEFHIEKRAFKTPFVCGARNLGEAMRRIHEGAALIRTKGEAGTGDIVHAVRHLRQLRRELDELGTLSAHDLELVAAKERVPLSVVHETAKRKALTVPQFAAGGIATPADAALCMALGAQSVFVGSGIFMSEDAPKRARAIVSAVTYYQDSKKLAEVSTGLGLAMRGDQVSKGATLFEGRGN